MPHLTLIAAIARNGVIGRGGDLVWREPTDQRHFRAKTLGHAVLMGRRTWDSLPARFRPLPGRRNLVVSRNAALTLPGAEVFSSLDAALAAVGVDETVCVIGGGELYGQALSRAGTLELTEIDADLDGDTLFPQRDPAEWVESAREPHVADDGTRFAFVTYHRRAPSEGTA